VWFAFDADSFAVGYGSHPVGEVWQLGQRCQISPHNVTLRLGLPSHEAGAGEATQIFLIAHHLYQGDVLNGRLSQLGYQPHQREVQLVAVSQTTHSSQTFDKRFHFLSLLFNKFLFSKGKW
jgi:hypothetical protein